MASNPAFTSCEDLFDHSYDLSETNAGERPKVKAAMERYKRLEKTDNQIGVGAYGVVYKCLDLETNKMVALKRIRLEVEDEGIPTTALREITILRLLEHPNIVKLENVVMDPGRLALVFELVDKDLRKFMDDHSGPLPIDLLRSYAAQLLEGLAYCHSMGVMHRDLKPHNILVDKAGNLKIADFGLARAFTPARRVLTVEVITRWYRPPEILLGEEKYTCSVDIWSAGCIIAELSTKRALFPGDSEVDQIHKIFRLAGTPSRESWPAVTELPYWRPSYPRWDFLGFAAKLPALAASDDLHRGISLLEKMLMLDPSKRLTAVDALRHPFVKDYLSMPASSRSPRHATYQGCFHFSTNSFTSPLQQTPPLAQDHSGFTECSTGIAAMPSVTDAKAITAAVTISWEPASALAVDSSEPSDLKKASDNVSVAAEGDGFTGGFTEGEAAAAAAEDATFKTPDENTARESLDANANAALVVTESSTALGAEAFGLGSGPGRLTQSTRSLQTPEDCETQMQIQSHTKSNAEASCGLAVCSARDSGNTSCTSSPFEESFVATSMTHEFEESRSIARSSASSLSVVVANEDCGSGRELDSEEGNTTCSPSASTISEIAFLSSAAVDPVTEAIGTTPTELQLHTEGRPLCHEDPLLAKRGAGKRAKLDSAAEDFPNPNPESVLPPASRKSKRARRSRAWRIISALPVVRDDSNPNPAMPPSAQSCEDANQYDPNREPQKNGYARVVLDHEYRRKGREYPGSA